MDLTKQLITLLNTASGRFFLIVSCALAFPQQSGDGMGTASEVLHKAVNSELKAQSNDHSRWMYQEKTKMRERNK